MILEYTPDMDAPIFGWCDGIKGESFTQDIDAAFGKAGRSFTAELAILSAHLVKDLQWMVLP